MFMEMSLSQLVRHLLFIYIFVIKKWQGMMISIVTDIWNCYNMGKKKVMNQTLFN